MNKTEYIAFHKQFCQDMVEITQKKNADYTGGAENPFANFLGIGNLVSTPNAIEIGFLTRMSDKIARIGSYVSQGTLQVKDESVQDTLKDLANYCALFSGYLESQKTPTKTAGQIAEDKAAQCIAMTQAVNKTLGELGLVPKFLEIKDENNYPTIAP